MSDWPWDLTFEVAFATDPGTEPGVWTDLSSRVRSPVTTAHGRAGNANPTTLTLNNADRALDPTNAASPHYPNIVPWRHARLTVTYDGDTYPLFRGFVEDWPPMWPTFNQSLVDVRLLDGFAWVALTETDVDLPAQSTGDRIDALLDIAGWPAGLRDLDTGVVTVEPYEQEDVSVLRVLIDTVDSEDGYLYAAPDGKITFRDRHHTFGAAPVLAFGPDDHKPRDVNPRFGGRNLVNIGRSELANGDVYEIVDDASVTRHGPHPGTQRDLPLNALEAQALPQWNVVRYAEPRLALDGLRVNGHTQVGSALGIAQLLPARIGDVATFEHSPTGAGVVEMTGVFEEIEHMIGKGEWHTTVALAPWFGEGPWFTWDVPALGWDLDAVWAP